MTDCRSMRHRSAAAGRRTPEGACEAVLASITKRIAPVRFVRLAGISSPVLDGTDSGTGRFRAGLSTS